MDSQAKVKIGLSKPCMHYNGMCAIIGRQVLMDQSFTVPYTSVLWL